MNYLRIYNNLITKRRENVLTEGYYEKHHILPRSCGGTDDKDNIIRLTAREHIIAHRLLMRIYEDSKELKNLSKMAVAVRLMSRDPHKALNGKYPITSREYEYLRKLQTTIMGKNYYKMIDILSNYGSVQIPDDVKFFPKDKWMNLVTKYSTRGNRIVIPDIEQDFMFVTRMSSMELNCGIRRLEESGYQDFIGLLRTMDKLN